MAEDLAASEFVDLGATESLCPACLRRIPARRVARGLSVWLVKRCPEHGEVEAVIWRGPPSFEEWAAGRKRPAPDLAAQPFCPEACGLCAAHRQPTCCALVEVTQRCDLRCPTCYADAGGASADPPLAALEARIAALLARGPANVQLSGGEPTLRDDLPALVVRARAVGAPFVQLNTNGLRLARDPDLALRLRDAGLGCVFLQFDGVTEEPYLALRGARLFAVKRRAIERCRAAGLGVVLVPTVMPGVNDRQLGALLRFALAEGPAVRGLHLQPVSWFGRCPRTPCDEDRITLPELMRGLEEQSGGLVRAAWLHAPSAESAHCSFSGTFQRSPDGGLQPLPRAASCCCGDAAGESQRARRHVAARWSLPAAPPPATETSAFDEVLAAAREGFTLSAMAFQDAWTIDLARLRDCYLHVAQEDRAGGLRLLPFCACNLTSAAGVQLHARRGAAP